MNNRIAVVWLGVFVSALIALAVAIVWSIFVVVSNFDAEKTARNAGSIFERLRSSFEEGVSQQQEPKP